MKRIIREFINSIPFIIVLTLVTLVCVNLCPGIIGSNEMMLASTVKAAEEPAPTKAAETIIEQGPKVAAETAAEKPAIVEAHPIEPTDTDDAGESQPEPSSPYAAILNQISADDRDILVRLTYHESRGKGGHAVIETVLNRMLDSRFPNTVQGVVYQKNQFEPAKGLYSWEIKEPEAFAKCKEEVAEVLSSDYQPILPSYYVYFNNFGAGDTEDYCWLGGNVFFGEYTLGF